MADGLRVASIGELLVEFVCAETDSHHRRVAPYAGPFPSGAPAIFISQAARLGARATFAGAVGTDAFGAVLLDRLQADGVALDLIRQVADRPTGTAMVAYNSDGSRDFVFNIAQSAAPEIGDASDVIAGLSAFKPDVLHVSGSSLAEPRMAATVVAVAEALSDAGVAISFDPNIRKELAENAAYRATVERLMALSRIFLPSDDDLAFLFPDQTFETCVEQLFAQATEVAVLKRGARGAVAIARGGDAVAVGGHKVQALDPTGAGDCFCATFVTLMASGGYDLRAALERANAAGALAVTKLGPMEGNAPLVEIERLLKQPVGLAS